MLFKIQFFVNDDSQVLVLVNYRQFSIAERECGAWVPYCACLLFHGGAFPNIGFHSPFAYPFLTNLDQPLELLGVVC